MASEKVLEFMASKPRLKRLAACFSRFGSALSHGMWSETVGVALRQLGDDGAILDLVEDVARLALAGEAGKARAAGADAPGGHGDGEGRDLGLDRVDVDAAAVEALAQVS